MKSWHSISTRLAIVLVGLTLGSLSGLSLVLDAALKNFFVRDALATLGQQSDVCFMAVAIAQEICQLQGGYLQIESQPDQGTIVRLLLPIRKNQS